MIVPTFFPVNTPPPPRTCEHCGGRLYVYCSRISGAYRVRYLRCERCGRPPKEGGKQVVPLVYAPPRKP